MDNKSMINSI